MTGPGVRRTIATRRWFIGASALLPAVLAVPARAADPVRTVVLDWGLAETLVALGAVPLGVGEAAGYARRVIEPALPPGVIDVGLRVSPNVELLQQLAPDVILVPPWIGQAKTVLERIAPVMVGAIYGQLDGPYAAACAVTEQLGARTGRGADATDLIAQTDTVLAAARPAAGSRPLYVVSFIDADHIAVYGRGSMFHDVLQRLGRRNAWGGPANATGAAVTGLERLTDPEAEMVTIGPVLPDPAALAGNLLWTSLPCVAAGRVTALPPVWFFGALPSAARFARLLASHGV